MIQPTYRSRWFTLFLSATLLAVLSIPFITQATRANQEQLTLAPGDRLMVRCDTALDATLQGQEGEITCARPLSDPTNAVDGPVIAGFEGVESGQTISGQVDVEAVVSSQDDVQVRFQLTGPASATHTEKAEPFYLFGDRSGVPNGWDTTNAPDGEYILTATVRNAAGAGDTQAIRFRVANNPTAEPEPTTEAIAFREEPLEFGAAAHLFYIDRDRPLQAASAAGFGWIRQQIHWRDIEGPAGQYAWDELDEIVEAANDYDMKLLLSVVRSPNFYTANGRDGMPENPEDLANFVGALARHYQGDIHGIEIWNEPNLAYENGGVLSIDDAEHYVELLKAAYTSIKSVDPDLYVISAPMASTGLTVPGVSIDDLTYYEAMFSYQNGVIGDYMDALGVHPGAAANAPDTLWPDKPGQADGWTDHSTFYFRHIEHVRELMEQYGIDDRPVWITEFGWSTPNKSSGYEFGNQITYEQQGEYIVEAMQLTEEQYPWVDVMILWNLNFAPLKANDGKPYHEQASFSILDSDYKPRPAFWSIRRYLKEHSTVQEP